MLPLLTALNIWDGGWPPFCSAVCFELWSDAEGRGRPDMVRVLYNRDGTVAERDDGGCFVELARWSLPSFAALVSPQVPAALVGYAPTVPRHSMTLNDPRKAHPIGAALPPSEALPL